MASFKKGGRIRDFQKFVEDVYLLPNDRVYASIWSFLTQKQRFVMRALKGVRKGDKEKIKMNLLISFSWFMSVCNKLHIDIEDIIWERFPRVCSYCGNCPCVCKTQKVLKRKNISLSKKSRPKSLKDFQKMFDDIYPSNKRTITEAGVHLAEETGEVVEAMDNYFGQHTEKQFKNICLELADFCSCLFGLANSVSFDVEAELVKICKNNCHVCHKAPCVCSFEDVMKFRV